MSNQPRPIEQVVVSRSAKTFSRLAAAIGVFAYAAFIGGMVTGSPRAFAAWAVTALAAIAFSIVAGTRGSTRNGTLTVRDGVVYLGTQRLTETRLLRKPGLLVTERGAFLTLEESTVGRTQYNFSFPTRGAALEAMAMLGVDVASVTTEHRVATPWAAPVWAVLLSTVWFATHFQKPLLILGIVPLVLYAFLSARVVVGADGVVVKWLWTRKRYRLSDIARFDVGPKGVFLFLHDRRTIDLRIRRDSGNVEKRRLAERIYEAMEAAHGRKPFDESLLVRGERALGDWIRGLRDLVVREETFRQAGVRAADLIEVALDGRRPELERAAAAAAVATHLDDDERARIRIAAETTVSPALRVALTSAADDDETELERALGELEKERMQPQPLRASIGES